jgi:DNA repair ATPase RecN
MKKKISLCIAGGLLVASPAFCDFFGGDLPILLDILTEARQQLAQAKQIYQEIQTASMYVKHPQSWQSYLDTAQSAINEASSGSDNAALKHINQTLRASQEAYNQINSSTMTTANMAALSQLALQQIQLKQQADQLNTNLQYQVAVTRYAQAGEGDIRVGSSLTRSMK